MTNCQVMSSTRIFASSRLSNDPPEGNSLRSHIHSLRQKIDKLFDSKLIHTVHGVGLYISKLVCAYQGWSLELLANPDGGIIARVGFDA